MLAGGAAPRAGQGGRAASHPTPTHRRAWPRRRQVRGAASARPRRPEGHAVSWPASQGTNPATREGRRPVRRIRRQARGPARSEAKRLVSRTTRPSTTSVFTGLMLMNPGQSMHARALSHACAAASRAGGRGSIPSHLLVQALPQGDAPGALLLYRGETVGWRRSMW